MRIITRKRLDEAATAYPNAKTKIQFWYAIAKGAGWRNFAQTRATFRHADQVRVASGRTVTVFNLANAYRLITAVHYNRRCVYILLVLTHAEYDKEDWKKIL
jgi:mRNA interferase HigB